MNCTGEYKKEYTRMMKSDNVEVDKVTCNLVNSLVETCGELWGLCHSREEVVRMKNMQMENMISKNSESPVDIEKCLAISQYRRRMASREPEIGCSQEEEEESRVQFQICSHNTTTQLYEDVQTLNTLNSVMDSVCQALKDLSDECFSYLAECLPDISEMKKLHFKEVTDFLVKIADGKVIKNDISECDAFNEVLNSDKKMNSDYIEKHVEMNVKSDGNDYKAMDEMSEENERFPKILKISEKEVAVGNAQSIFQPCVLACLCLWVIIVRLVNSIFS